MRPNAKNQKDADYFKVMVEKTNLSHTKLAKTLGVSDRSIRRYLKSGAPYTVQFAVECLVYCID